MISGDLREETVGLKKITDNYAQDAHSNASALAASNAYFAVAIISDVIFSIYDQGRSFYLRKAGRLWESIVNDCEFVEQNSHVSELIKQPLWQSDEFKRVGIGIKNAQLFSALIDLADHWSIWKRWYQARLDGRPTINAPADIVEKLDLDIATIADEDWRKGADHVNPMIAEMYAKAEAEAAARVAQEEADFTQRPASYHYRAVAGKIVAEPQFSQNDDAMRSVLLPSLLDKAKDAHERLLRSQIPVHVAESIERLIAELEKDQRIVPGDILSKSRSLAAILAVYNQPAYHEEFTPDLLILLEDLSGSLDDFKATYPELAKIEAARLAQEVQAQDIRAVKEEIKAIIDIARASDAVAPSAREALEKPLIESAEVEKLIELAPTDQAKADALEKDALIVSQSLLGTRNFISASFQAAKRGSLKGIEKGSEKFSQHLVYGTLMYLTYQLAKPVVILSLSVPSFQFLSKAIKELISKDESLNNDDDNPLDTSMEV